MMYFTPKNSRALLVSALTAAIASAVTAVQAQEEGALEEITVTGSRIRDTGMTTPTPVTAVDAGELSAMAPGNLIESLSQLPLFLNNEQPQTQFNFAGSAGASNLNLRGIGTQRTLVLLNGRRIVPSSRTNTVDINLFPDAMISQVESVTGGASAAYGTDAVAGVVNFILDTDFSGVEANLQSGVSSRGDADNYEGSFSFGTDIGADSHLLFSMGGFSQDGVNGYDERDWYQGWGTVTNPAWVDAGCAPNQACAAGPQLIRAPRVVSTQYTFGGLTVSPVAELNNLEFLSDGTVRPFQFSELSAVSGTQSQSIAGQYGGGSGDNFEADRGGEGGLIPDTDRENAFLYLDRDLSDSLNVYFQAIYGNSRTNAPAFSSLMFGPWQATVYADNAFLPDSLRQAMRDNDVESVGFSSLRSQADLGQARFEQENTLTSYTAGFNSTLSDGFGLLADWTLEGYVQHGETDSRIRMYDFPRIDRIFQAMDAVVDPASGSIVCRAALANPAQYGNCVPLNVLGAGQASPEALAYALGRDDGTNRKAQKADISQEAAEISLSGELADGWAGPISSAFGFAWRKDEMTQRIQDPTNPPNDQDAVVVPFNDPSQGIQGIPLAFQGGNTGFQFSGAQNFTGRIIVREAFGEVLMPVLADAPLAQQVNLNAAARWADYSGSGEVWSYKVGGDWQLNSALRLRATASRDVRAGSLSERFDAQGQGASAEDPFLGGISYAFGQTIGGNPRIDPEEADTYTLGFVYQPDFLPGLSLSLDWYEITTEGLIAQLGTQNIINQCFQGVDSQCGNITRSASVLPGESVGRITEVFNGYQNIGEAVVSGADLEVTYRTDVSWLPDLGIGGQNILLRSFYSYLDENSQDSDPDDPGTNSLQEDAGSVGAGLPRNKLTTQLTYFNGPWTAFVQGRYIGGGAHSARINGVSAVEGVHINDNTVSSVFYTDMNLAWNTQLNGGELEVFANVNNLFDREPPVYGSFFNFFGSTQQVESLHDLIGRRYTAGLRMRF